MEELDIKTAIQIAKILAAAPDERIPMILDVFSKAQVQIRTASCYMPSHWNYTRTNST